MGYTDPRVQTRDLSPLSALLMAERSSQLHAAIKQLVFRESELVKSHYLRGEPLKLYAERLGISRQRACQIKCRVLHRLAFLLRHSGLE